MDTQGAVNIYNEWFGNERHKKLTSSIDSDRKSLKEITIYYIYIFKTIQCLTANIMFYLVNTSMFNEIQCSCANSKFLSL